MHKEIIKELERKMLKSIEAYETELTTVRAGRANPAILDQFSVDYYGTDTPIKQVASISVPEARLLVIQPWDASSLTSLSFSNFFNLSIASRLKFLTAIFAFSA